MDRQGGSKFGRRGQFSTALDALAQRAQITALQVREALAGALKGLDLGLFETQARAAFDGSAQGARRLQAALDAIADESLRRAGTSLDELRGGFNKASNSAINDVDALAKTLRELGITGDDAGRALAKAIDQATAAASTERALRAVEDRVRELGEAGRLSGEQVTAALDRIARKADELRPGVNSLGEALRTFGLQTRAELQATADRMRDAYTQIANSTEVSVADQIKAFEAYRTAAIAANKGIEPAQVEVQRRILETRASVAGLGAEFEAAMQRSEKATRSAAAAMQSYLDLMQSDPGRLVGGNGLGGIGSSPSPSPSGAPAPSPGTTLDSGLVIGKGSTLGNDFWGDNRVLFAPGQTPRALSAVPFGGGGGGAGSLLAAPFGRTAAPAPAASSTVRVELKLPNGATRTVNTADQASADALLSLIEDDLRKLGVTG